MTVHDRLEASHSAADVRAGVDLPFPRGRQTAITSTGGTRVSFDPVDFYHKSARLSGVDSMGTGCDAIAAYEAAERGGRHVIVMGQE